MPSRQSTKVPLICNHCGKEFLVVPYEATKRPRKHCSRVCRDIARRVPFRERFQKYLSPPNERGCILWTGTRSANWYGHIWDRERGDYVATHRAAWEFAHGPIPDNSQVLHHCDEPLCCNPEHLFLGTSLDNMRDKVSKRRHSHGEKASWSKLTEAKVRAIFRRHKEEGIRPSQLAAENNVSCGAIQGILRGRNWKHLHLS